LIVPISLYEVGLQLHYQLKHYKDDGGTKMAWEFLVKTAALLGYFLKAAQHLHLNRGRWRLGHHHVSAVFDKPSR
jgi:hypothetical protein